MDSQIVVAGIITNTTQDANVLNIVRPVAEITVFDQENREWIDGILLIFTDNESARKFKGLNTGDVLLVTGELSYIAEKGYVIYVSRYTVLCKNKKNKPQSNKIMIFEGCNSQNFIYIKGHMIAYNEDKQIATVTHTINRCIRGDLERTATFPVHVQNCPSSHSGDCIVVGHFSKDFIEGDLWLIS